ncbi:MAG: TonB-dependent receptor [Rhizomicrobium sp.]
MTAQRRTEREHDVPISIAVLGADQLKDAQVTDLGAISNLVPGVRFDYDASFAQPTIRGIGTAVLTAGSGSNVGIYIDGFYNPAPLAADLQLVNVDNVQVLEGPQGTLFGHNTTGGAILVTTSKPSYDTHGMVDASYGSYNAQRYEGYFTTGVTDNVAVDFGGFFSKGDGYVHDIVTGSDTDGAYQNWSARIGIKYDLSDKISFLFRYQHTGTDDPTLLMTNAYVLNGVPQVPGALFGGAVATKPRQVADDTGMTALGNENNFQLTSTFDLGTAMLTSYTQYTKLVTDQKPEDLSATVLQPFPGVNIPFLHIYIPLVDKTFTQEFLMNSETTGRLKWTAGIFYMDYTDSFGTPSDQIILCPPTGCYSIGYSGAENVSAAAYFDATYQILDDLYLTGGVRFSDDDEENAFFNFPLPSAAPTLHVPSNPTVLPDLRGDRFAPRFVVRYTPNEDWSLYSSFTKSFKSAIYNPGGAQFAPVKPETINAYEIGAKYAAQGLSASVAGYYYDYTNLQVAAYGYNPITGQAYSTVNNAATSRILGLEGQVQYEIMDGLDVDAGANYEDAQYTKFPGDPTFQLCTDPITCGLSYGLMSSIPKNETNVTMLQAPKFTANLGARYSTGLAGGALALSGDLYYTSKIYFDSSDQFSQGAYALLNLRAQWTDPSGRYTVAVYGNNVTGANYRNQVLASNSGVTQSWGAPATFGGELAVHF